MRPVNAEELAARRHRLPRGWQRGVSSIRRRPGIPPGTAVGEDAGQIDTPTPRPVPPEEAHRRLLDHLIRNARNSRDDFQAAVRQLRKWNPALISHLTDEQAARVLEDQYDRLLRAATTRVYERTGRGRELQIRIP